MLLTKPAWWIGQLRPEPWVIAAFFEPEAGGLKLEMSLQQMKRKQTRLLHANLLTEEEAALLNYSTSSSAWSKCPLGSAPARPLCLLRARLAALRSSALPG